ncbi:receptor-like protein EIX2 isoform X2 [Cajanus cajan]|uniref:receptor-like protein EIX2 isoform X2 n=1 Tax=Cajanus cajan TaxID=3821 RepID=UPI0010FAE9F2|nr:receptor-like protein EIX2 isoform X2 [Cajanus cajan]
MMNWWIIWSVWLLTLGFGVCREIECIPSERETLMKLKHHLKDPSNRLSSWNHNNSNCCQWPLVVCNNVTAHVLQLHLNTSPPTPEIYEYYEFDDLIFEDEEAYYEAIVAYERSQIGGEINPCLGDLKHLNYLDLSGNYLLGQDWLSSLSKLEYLDLGYTNLSKSFHWLQAVGSLSSLKHLYLRGCRLPLPHYSQPSALNFTSLLTLDMSDTSLFSFVPKWIFGLAKLVSLQLRGNNIQGPIPDGIQNLTLLQNLDLSENLLSSSILDGLYSLGHLKFLNLEYNNLNGSISNALGNLTSLVGLHLSYNQLEGKIPTSLGNLCNLREIGSSYLKLNQQVNEILQILAPCISHGLTTLRLQSSQLSGNLTDEIGVFKNIVRLDFSNNSIGGALPRSFGKLSSLKALLLSKNHFTGNPFESLKSLSNLTYLSIFDNLFQGIVKEDDVANLMRLKYFMARGSNLTLKVGPNWHPSFQLTYLDMSSWQLGPNFPSWLLSQNKPQGIDISNTGILDSIPTWFWRTFSQASYVNLSHNHIFGELATTLRNPISTITVDLNTNHLCGKLPYLSNNVYWLDLSSNSFSGSMDDFLCKNLDKPMHLELLNLASNNLSGQIPDCWKIWPFLLDVNLQSNLFVGNLPPSIGSLAKLQFLQIRNNSLSGTLPTTLKKNIQLISLDLGENNLTGTIPMWVGERFINLRILGFRSNNFSGHIPNEICGMSHLQVLDLAHNKLSGNIPSCFNHLNAMTIMNKSTDPLIQTFDYSYSGSSIISMPLWLKGREDEYKSFLGLVTNIDLSNNKLSGEIPREITYLNELIFLNLSHNQLIGHIPQSIGNMKSIQTIDFSSNQLSGDIPPTISNLSFLSMLDLSYNHLKGKIPTGTQVQTFDASNFIGNKLCGPPLLINCSSIGKNPSYDHIGKESHRHEVKWFFVSMTFGFIMGFWIVIGPLLICKSWRYAYFDFLDHVWFKLQYYVDVVSLFNVVKSKIVM